LLLSEPGRVGSGRGAETGCEGVRHSASLASHAVIVQKNHTTLELNRAILPR
jgi:hypothetical protein